MLFGYDKFPRMIGVETLSISATSFSIMSSLPSKVHHDALCPMPHLKTLRVTLNQGDDQTAGLGVASALRSVLEERGQFSVIPLEHLILSEPLFIQERTWFTDNVPCVTVLKQ